jgi:hypothetical protein
MEKYLSHYILLRTTEYTSVKSLKFKLFTVLKLYVFNKKFWEELPTFL